ncbi:hypothetical protein QFC19_002868 [Naganishia cerealis]|uniref:Uncharacterized protein n=1 Tax=Naganishia cerealis TaxID=610337 RepID=A0ACC2W6P3_9TREE|nr:hypothetical protein QFC19_002868 [Naganishia cerealis]
MIPGAPNEHFIAIAESLKPTLNTTKSSPLRLIKCIADENAILGWAAEDAGKLDDIKSLRDGDEIIFDFGTHRAGFFEFDIDAVLTGVEPADAPVRLKIVFGEVLNDVAESFDDYKAWISKSWLPEEIINIDYLPALKYRMSRRHAFRYIKIQVISTSLRFGVTFNNPTAYAVSSAPTQDPSPLSFSKAGDWLSEEEKTKLRKIDEVSLRTLRNCMHTVYEDGPRRDMRLWIGDLRLQALCSYATFKDYNLAKRCLYLFAGLPFNDEGLLCACVYEKPVPKFGGNSIVDYAMLFAVTLLDYVKASGDLKCGEDLFPIASKQFSFFAKNFTEDLRYIIPERSMSDGGEGWHFIDWQPTLDKESSEHAIMIYCLKATQELAEKLNLDTPLFILPDSPSAAPLPDIVERLINAHRRHYFDPSRGVFVSGKDRQLSWAANAWAVLAGVPESKEAGARAMQIAYETKNAITGMTPYLHHYLCEAFVAIGQEKFAVKHIIDYWGSMVDAGAETFWEGWDPKQPRSSPYGDLHSNS